MLQRVYGTAFFDKKELDAYLAQIEEAKKRDHRKLGKELGLFTISPAGRLGPDPLDAQGGDRPGRPRELPEGRADQARLSAGLHAAHRQDRALQDAAATIPYYKDSQFPTLKMLADAGAWNWSTAWSAGTLDDAARRCCSPRRGIPDAGRDYWSAANAAGAESGYVEEHGV